MKSLLLLLSVAIATGPLVALTPQQPSPDKAQPDKAQKVALGDPPKDAAARVAWIARMIERFVASSGADRDAVIKKLAVADEHGDCTGPLVAYLPRNPNNTTLLLAIIRGLGRDGLMHAAPAIAAQLTHKNKSVRSNAAVSLEYIGCGDKQVLAALRKLTAKERDTAIANHAYRALGRCGSKDAKVRALLLKRAISVKSEYASYGPCIGLAYFKGDEKAVRGVEKLLKKIGVPSGGGAFGATNAVKRSLVSWTLANIGGEKSAEFVRGDLMARLKHTKAPWVEGQLNFWHRVSRACDGEPGMMPFVEGGVRGAVKYVKGLKLERYGAETRNLMDDARKGRTGSGFTPKGDHVLNDKK